MVTGGCCCCLLNCGPTYFGTALPLSFNGFGIREAGYVGLAVWFGGSAEAAGAMALLWVLVLAVASAPGGIVLWRMGGKSILERDRHS
ncbi:MAG: hypothetical protein R8K50_07630 [Mariprofundus sp.]